MRARWLAYPLTSAFAGLTVGLVCAGEWLLAVETALVASVGLVWLVLE